MDAFVLFDFYSQLNDELSCRKDDTISSWKGTGAKLCYTKKTFIRLRPIPGFMGTTSRSRAEEILKRIATDNTFLVRESETCPGDFSISFFYKSVVKHAMIAKDSDNKFAVSEKKFTSINSLIEFYAFHTISRSESIRLVHPIPESLVFGVAENFTARDEKELTMRKGDTVVVTNYSDRNWWVGSCRDNEGMFPVRFIQPVNYPTIFTDSNRD